MIRVVQHGRSVKIPTHQGLCTCGCRFEFTADEAERVSDYRLIGDNCKTGVALKINCPECPNTVWVYDV